MFILGNVLLFIGLILFNFYRLIGTFFILIGLSLNTVHIYFLEEDLKIVKNEIKKIKKYLKS